MASSLLCVLLREQISAISSGFGIMVVRFIVVKRVFRHDKTEVVPVFEGLAGG